MREKNTPRSRQKKGMTTKKHTVRLEIPDLHGKQENWLPACVYTWADRWGWATDLRIRRTATAIEIEGEPLSINADEWERTWSIALHGDTWTARAEYGIRFTALGKKTTTVVKTWAADGLHETDVEVACAEVPFTPALGYGWGWQPMPAARTDGSSWLNEPRHGQREKPWERLDQAISPVIFAKALGFFTFQFPGEEETIIFDENGRYAGVVRSGEWVETSGLSDELDEAKDRLEAARACARAKVKAECAESYPPRVPDDTAYYYAEARGTRDEQDAVAKLKARIAESNYRAQFYFPTGNGSAAFALDEGRAVGSHEMLTALVGGRSTAAKLAARYRDNFQPLVAWLHSQRNKPQPAIEAAAERLIALPRPKKSRPVKNTPFTGQNAETFRTILAACGGDVERAMKVIATIVKEVNR